MSEPFIKGGPESSKGPGQAPESPHEMVAGVEPSPFKWWMIPVGLLVLGGLVLGGMMLFRGSWPGFQPVRRTCGNGVVDDGEMCDGDDMTQCLSTQECHDCQCVFVEYQPGCGNGIVDPGEQCDAPDLTQCLDTQECHNCQCVFVVEADTCGDGIVDEGEECDGSTVGCQIGLICEDCACVQLPTCGNGVVDGDMDTEIPEQCDGDDTPCPPCYHCLNCVCAPYLPDTCGNGIVDECEYCDGDALGTCIGGLVCSDWCTCMWPLCGNGELDEDEECDPEYNAGYCPSDYICHNCACVQPDVCGNGIVEFGEDCDGDDMMFCTAGQACENCQCVTRIGFCGDGTCDPTTENTDLCPEDCVCVDDGECGLGEGLNCADCGDPVGACGTRCASSETCPDPLSCFDGHCWDGCLCGGDCGGEVECWCVGYDRHCSDGTVELRGCYP